MAAAKKLSVKINGKSYPLQHGVKFLNTIGILPKKTEENVDRMGIILMGLSTNEPYTLVEIAQAGLAHEDFTEDEIVDAVFEGGIDETTFAEYEAFLDKSPLGSMLRKLKKEIQAFMPNLAAEIKEQAVDDE